MDKVIFKISRNMLTISLLKKNMPKVNLNNTNVIDTKEIVFSSDYIKDNLELVSSFLNVIILKREVKRVTIKDHEQLLLLLKIINLMPSLEELYIKADKVINYQIFMALLDNKSLKLVEVFDIPRYLLERLDVNKDLVVKVRSEILFISTFMTDNGLTSYSDLYYAKSINIYAEFKEADYDEFNTFMSINHHLKTVTLTYFSKELLSFVISALLENNKTHIKIAFEEKYSDVKEIYEAVNDLKKKQEKLFKENDIIFKINYSPEFKYNNLFKQLNINFIKISTLCIIVLILLLMGLNYYKNYAQKIDIKSIEDELQVILDKIDEEYTLDDNTIDIDYIEPEDPNNTPTTTKKKSTYVSSYYKNYAKVFETLLKINGDTKGWLTVNNTRIDYPVVQAKNNDFYLTRDFNKVTNSMGWIFMDYRNDINNLNHNTIIYGHNISNGGIMFGTLRYTVNKEWYTKAANQIVTFNTLNASMKWQIFSIYSTPNTTDYLITSFYDGNEYQKWLDKLRNRSIYDFKQTVTINDKILTLSTCQNRGSRRLVLHAVLIQE